MMSSNPDLALCLHFNASPMNMRRPSFQSPNHLHLLINGCYSRGEIQEDDTRFEMLLRILQRVYYEEVELSDAITRPMKSEIRLPSFSYDGTNGMSVNVGYGALVSRDRKPSLNHMKHPFGGSFVFGRVVADALPDTETRNNVQLKFIAVRRKGEDEQVRGARAPVHLVTSAPPTENASVPLR